MILVIDSFLIFPRAAGRDDPDRVTAERVDHQDDGSVVQAARCDPAFLVLTERERINHWLAIQDPDRIQEVDAMSLNGQDTFAVILLEFPDGSDIRCP